MKAERTVKRITFDRNEAKPGETLYVSVPKLNKHEVILLSSLFLVFDIDLSGGHENIFLVQNVSRALVNKLFVKFVGTTLQDTVGYDIYKIFEDLFLSEDGRNNMLLEGLQSEDLSKICSNAGNKKTWVWMQKISWPKSTKISTAFIWTTRSCPTMAFYTPRHFTTILFSLISPAEQVVMGSDADKLFYKLTNFQLQYETIRSKKTGRRSNKHLFEWKGVRLQPCEKRLLKKVSQCS